MPISTVNWLWIGNRSLLDPTPNTSITVAQRNAIGGYSASGSTEIVPTAVTGDYQQVGATGEAFQFATVWDAPRANVRPTLFSYSTNSGEVSQTTMISAFRVEMRIQTASEPDAFRTEPATLVQMQNGDLFFRPTATAAAGWADITRVYGIEIAAVSQTVGDSFGLISHTTSFRPGIFDVAFPCFAADTLIETAEGPCRAGALRVGQMVRTAGGGFQPILWIGSRRLDGIDLARRPQLRPVRIAPGALAPGVPRQPLILSRQHRVLVRSPVAVRMFGSEEVLIAAAHLTDVPGIEPVEECDSITYVHFMFDCHRIVLAEGAAVESLYAGPQALTMLPAPCRNEILALFPELAAGRLPLPAHPLIDGRRGRKLARRHAAKGRALLGSPRA